jgi:hypothetical protein
VLAGSVEAFELCFGLGIRGCYRVEVHRRLVPAKEATAPETSDCSHPANFGGHRGDWLLGGAEHDRDYERIRT